MQPDLRSRLTPSRGQNLFEADAEGGSTDSRCARLQLPADVGIRIASGSSATFQLEVHYNSFGSSDLTDHSGTRICATSKLRKHEAAPVVLGGVCFGPLCSGLPPGRSEVTNSCVNLSTTGPAHVLWTSPHMHKFGRHLKTIITRSDGTVETLTDQEYSYDNQQDYPFDMLIYVRRSAHHDLHVRERYQRRGQLRRERAARDVLQLRHGVSRRQPQLTAGFCMGL